MQLFAILLYSFQFVFPSCAQQETKLKHSVDILAFFTAFCYAIIIPCCLLYLYGKQHVFLQKSRTTVAIAVGHSTLKVSVNELLDPTIPKKSGKEFTRRLVAAAAAHISVLYRGRVSQMHLDFFRSKRSSRQCRAW